MKPIILLFFVFLMPALTMAQFGGGGKFIPGYYYDINGQKVPGLINRYPAGKGIMKNEGFIEFKEDDKARPQRLSASMIHSFIIGRDSFTIAMPPRYGGPWSKNELDFVQVIVDGPTKLYLMSGGSGGSGGGHGSRIRPEFSTGLGTGGMGMGGGIGINLGGGGSSGGGSVRNAYYYGETTGEMAALKAETFIEVMTDVMGDEPDVVEKIRAGIFNVGNMDGLVKYYKQIAASHNR
ncbi:hypothetical protein [Mucilaginibacter paludis]|uniref:Uncharacterized protein n=1 Tax=Mucilaginibacter paludis DSM 18603 TaxID=714943 RepID=H1Y389_9SPHI|nr:hypothetical protein [Mucilaginibacter paludis]EHQ29244.1 hypothetical protein Mucpa_5169 [Mucilaginibacter paludis DSM 18603]